MLYENAFRTISFVRIGLEQSFMIRLTDFNGTDVDAKANAFFLTDTNLLYSEDFRALR